MDIDSLSRLISRILREHESVALPGLGSFETQLAPASFSDKGYTINPPYRRVVFRERVESDTYLVQAYAAEKGITEEESSRLVSGFLKALGMELMRRSHIMLPGLGRLKAIKDGGIIFVANEDADIYPDGFGLEPVSLKSRIMDDSEPIDFFPSEADLYPIVERPVQEEDKSEAVSEAVTAAKEPAAPQPAATETVEQEPAATETVEQEPAATETVEQEPAATETVEQEPAAHHHHHRRKHGTARTILLTILWIIALAALSFAVFMLLCDVAPDFIDSILYTKEELSIINA